MEDAKTKEAPVAWAYEYHDFGDVWARAVVLNRPDGGANPPTAHHGSQVRNVRPLFAAPQPAASDVPHDVVRADSPVAEWKLSDETLAQLQAIKESEVNAAVMARTILVGTPAPSTSTEAKCFECDGPLHGPYCPACRPTEEALRAENARLRIVVANLRNELRGTLSALSR